MYILGKLQEGILRVERFAEQRLGSFVNRWTSYLQVESPAMEEIEKEETKDLVTIEAGQIEARTNRK